MKVTEIALAAVDVALAAGKNNRTYTLMDQSPVSVLANMVHSTIAPEEKAAACTPDAFVALLQGTWEKLMAGTNTGYQLSTTADKLIQVVCSDISYFQNTVYPITHSIVEELVASQNKPVYLISSFNIVEYDLPNPLKETGYEERFGAFENESDWPKVYRHIRAGMKNPQEILEFLATGNKSFDEATREWFVGLDQSAVADIWIQIFNTSEPSYRNSLAEIYTKWGSKNVTMLDAALLVYMIAEQLKEKPPEIVEGSESTFYNDLNVISDHAGLCVYWELERFNNGIKNGDIVQQYITSYDGLGRYSLPSYCKGAVVYKTTYMEWLKRGGTPEVLAGARLATNGDKTPMDDETLFNNRVAYHETYHNYSAMARTNQELDSLQIFKDTFESVFISQLAVKNELEAAAVKDFTDFDNRVIKSFYERLANVYLEDLTDIHSLVVSIVCDTRFYYTNANMFLSAMIRYSKTSENVTEACTRATMLYVGEYFEQFIQCS